MFQKSMEDIKKLKLINHYKYKKYSRNLISTIFFEFIK